MGRPTLGSISSVRDVRSARPRFAINRERRTRASRIAEARASNTYSAAAARLPTRRGPFVRRARLGVTRDGGDALPDGRVGGALALPPARPPPPPAPAAPTPVPSRSEARVRDQGIFFAFSAFAVLQEDVYRTSRRRTLPRHLPRARGRARRGRPRGRDRRTRRRLAPPALGYDPLGSRASRCPCARSSPAACRRSRHKCRAVAAVRLLRHAEPRQVVQDGPVMVGGVVAGKTYSARSTSGSSS